MFSQQVNPGWGTFPKCGAKHGLVLGPLFWDCPLYGAKLGLVLGPLFWECPLYGALHYT